ncbi:MAG TPA: histidine kinase [Rhizomicrobium sp.]|nr:histidine kinase [Rhizomicrobium sp.]
MRWGAFRIVLIVVAAWTLVALAWTPPTILVQALGGPTGLRFTTLEVFANVLLGFVPWMAATPLILWLGRRWPVSEDRVAVPLAIHAAAGAIVVPLVTGLGVVLGRLMISRNVSLDILGAVLITAFYSIPTYVAVVAVGQALGYFERARLRERLLARAELRALKAQLNPHFLFNALNAISALGYRDAARADEALTRLAQILRTSLDEWPELVALKDEIAFVQGYVDLYALLLPNRAALAIEVEPEAWNALVPGMLLQPLVENALLHGDGSLSLSAKRDGGRLLIGLRNPVAPEPSSKGAGIGLANARERLRVLFGDAATLGFTRDASHATVAIALPFAEAQT